MPTRHEVIHTAEDLGISILEVKHSYGLPEKYESIDEAQVDARRFPGNEEAYRAWRAFAEEKLRIATTYEEAVEIFFKMPKDRRSAMVQHRALKKMIQFARNLDQARGVYEMLRIKMRGRKKIPRICRVAVKKITSLLPRKSAA